MASVYLDVPGYLRAAAGEETVSLLGLNTTIADGAAVAAGATTLPVTASTGWAVGPLWLLDAASSEMVWVVGAADGTHLTLAALGTQFAHAAGVSASQAGTAGSLAETLLRASAWIEGYCQQGIPGDRSLFAQSRTERWALPGPRAWLDRDGVLVVRPGHFPLQSVAALAVESAPGQSLALDISQIELPSDGRLVEAPLLAMGGGVPLPLAALGLSRARQQWITLTYTGGLPVDAVPYDVRQVCVWVANELLALRRNPSGAAELRQGKFELQQRTRTDTAGESLLMIQAKAALEPYRERGM